MSWNYVLRAFPFSHYGKSRTAYNKGLEYNDVSQEEFAVEVPEIRGDVGDYDLFDNYERAEKW